MGEHHEKYLKVFFFMIIIKFNLFCIKMSVIYPSKLSVIVKGKMMRTTRCSRRKLVIKNSSSLILFFSLSLCFLAASNETMVIKFNRLESWYILWIWLSRRVMYQSQVKRKVFQLKWWDFRGVTSCWVFHRKVPVYAPSRLFSWRLS